MAIIHQDKNVIFGYSFEPFWYVNRKSIYYTYIRKKIKWYKEKKTYIWGNVTSKSS